MTPAEKAKDLFDKMNGFRITHAHRIKCAKIVVDEIDRVFLESTSKDDPYKDLQSLEYWQQVKTELDKLKKK